MVGAHLLLCGNAFRHGERYADRRTNPPSGAGLPVIATSVAICYGMKCLTWAVCPYTVPVRIVFAGTPETALPALRRLIESPRHEVLAVLTRPDAASGRHGMPQPSPVARMALDHGIPVLRPRRPNTTEFVAELSELEPDCCPVVAYGALLGDGLLAVPTHGWINLHFSLLPAWRGAAPVQAAVAAGDTVTGATTFQIESGLDSGPIYGVITEAVRPTDTAGDLLDRLAISGAALLSATLDGIADGALTPTPQPAHGVSLAPKITVDQARVRWDLPAHVVDRSIRAVTPNPGAWTLIGDLRVKLGPVQYDDDAPKPPKPMLPGDIHVDRRSVWIGTGSEPVRLGEIQPPGKKFMSAIDWARGARLDPGGRVS
jgi:methionyl-tRNA formyltransferase